LGELAAGTPGAMLRSAQDRVHNWLRSEGLADGDVHIDIGSGQSRSERGTPHALVQLLHRAWAGSGSQAFIDSLPIAGVDGTLETRMRGTPAEKRVLAKTGTSQLINALAGYATTVRGERLAFAIFVNNHAGKSREAVRAIDRVAAALADAR
jgi:D-alanyl-D-alanine carboxypeptidase/D-alanyl-D-alanine-endopeptidase (penicillin-binding protein 4)